MATLAPPKLTAQEYIEQYPETNQRMELINGEIITMPSPFDYHSDVISNIMWILQSHVRPQKLGKVKTEPTDIHLDDYNVVQPDVFFIHKDNTRCQVAEDGYLHGAPDLCIEVLSKSTAKHDRTVKFDLYEGHGVREYWMVEPELKLVEVFILQGEHFIRQGAYTDETSFNSAILPDLLVNLADIFEGLS